MTKSVDLSRTLTSWKEQWPQALKVWSNYVKLREPEWCVNATDAKRAGISESFAMIRLKDHRIVIDIRKVVELGAQEHAMQVLAHEIGHHIYTPANLKDNASVLAKVRWALAGIESQAPMVANLYEDLLINDRLQRSKQLDMATVYKCINRNITFSKLWTLYMRVYEYLWKLKRGELATDLSLHSDSIDADASIIASLLRSYSKNWMDGASRFGAMLYPYLMNEKDAGKARKAILVILDAEDAGEDGGIVAGMASLDSEALEGVRDPRTEAMGAESSAIPVVASLADKIRGAGPKQRYLHPGAYVDLFKQVNPKAGEQELIVSYYKEIALPYLIEFPKEKEHHQVNMLPEGLDIWDVGDSIDEIDWVQTTINSSQIFPGVNTVKRIYGPSGDEDESKAPLDVYLGIDCSGSMGNPAVSFSWPVLAATIIALSALRAGARAMVCLSGEPGKFMQNDGFISNEKNVMSVLTSYLGTGYAFGVKRLKAPFEIPLTKKSHVIIVTDDNIFRMLDATTDSDDDLWEVMERSLEHAGGSGTVVLHSQPQWHRDEVQRLVKMGWHVHYVTNEEELLGFGSSFAKSNY